MQIQHHVHAILFSLSCLLWLVSSVAYGQINLEQNTGDPRTFSGCPAISITALTCRDGHCDDNENPTNCPEDCADRSSQLMGYYTQGIVCPVTTIYEPTSLRELRKNVRGIVSSGRKIKPAGSSHSATDIICPDTNSDVIRTTNMTKIRGMGGFEDAWKAVHFEAGATFIQLQEWLAAKNFTMGLSTPGYGGITLGGAIATGAHGSSLLDHSTISSQVLSLEVVQPNGDLALYTRGTTGVDDPDLWQALLTNMGLLGVVARIRIEVYRQYNIEVEVKTVSEDTFVNTDNGVADAVADCDYVFLTWFPGQDEVRYLCGNKTAEAVDSEFAVNQLFTPEIDALGEAFAIPALQFAMCNNSTLGCFIEEQRVNTYQDSPPLVITEDATPNSPVVSRHNSLIGLSHRMVTLHPDRFARQPALSQLEYEGAMPMSEIQGAVKYLKSIYDRDGVCQPLIGTIMRFDRADDNTLIAGNSVRAGISDGDQLVHLEFVEYWGYDWSQATYDNYISNPYTEIVTHLINNYNFWPHWGKNDEWVFTEPMVRARNQPAIDTFNAQIAKVDPYGVFSNASSRRNGFISPQEGEDFADYYFPRCDEDDDGDGIMNCADLTPDAYSGMYTRIKELHCSGGWWGCTFNPVKGSCNYADSWDEMKNNFGATKEQNMKAGWDYDTRNYNYNNSNYSWSPTWSGGDTRDWEVMFSAIFIAEKTGRYCFHQDNGASRDSGSNKVNSCGQVWVDKNLMAESGLDGINQFNGCINLTAGEETRLDFYNRHGAHNVFWMRHFKSEPRWCFGDGGDCTPNLKFQQKDLTVRSDL